MMLQKEEWRSDPKLTNKQKDLRRKSKEMGPWRSTKHGGLVSSLIGIYTVECQKVKKYVVRIILHSLYSA